MVSKVIEFSPPESSRVYNFPGGERICFYDVVKITVLESGVHYVERIDGYTHEIVKTIVNTGWLTIEVSGEEDWPGDEGCMCGGECKCVSDTPELGHWNDDDKLQLAIAADEIICIADDLRANPSLQKFFEWMENNGFF
jgi:hypothetical protein